MNLKFSQLNKTYFTISDILVERQQDIGEKRFVMEKPRPTDALILFTGANSICYEDGEMPLYVPQGALVYVPKNSKYIWEDSPAADDGKLEKLLFEFTLNFVETVSGKADEIHISSVTKEQITFGNNIGIISIDYYPLYKKYFEKLLDAFASKNQSVANVLSVAYELFDIISKNHCLDAKSKLNFKIIESGIKYIEETPCPNKSVNEIADMCGVSVGHFERSFKEYSGITPTEYINKNKILYIKKRLQERDLNLSDIAEEMRYCDSSYLCRFFKKNTGLRPKEYRNLYFSSLE